MNNVELDKVKTAFELIRVRAASALQELEHCESARSSGVSKNDQLRIMGLMESIERHAFHSGLSWRQELHWETWPKVSVPIPD